MMPSQIILIALAFWLNSCSYLTFWKSSPEEAVSTDPNPIEEVKEGNNIRPASPAELELKQARLWARVDEMEEQFQRQKERLHLIEKGLILGIVPEELKRLAEEEAKANKLAKGAAKAKQTEATPKDTPVEDKKGKNEENKDDSAHQMKQALSEENGANLTPEQKSDYQKRMANAQDQMREGRYGRAIVELDEITKLYGANVGGALHLYWLGKSWTGLKDYQAAKQIFAEFIAKQPTSPWFPRAKLELARVELQLGLRETALQRFKEIIEAFPDEDASEMARMELKHMKQSL